jgi:hypothetical protein
MITSVHWLYNKEIQQEKSELPLNDGMNTTR